MSSIDKLRTDRTCVRWAKLDPANGSVLHEPKRHGDVGWDLEAAEETVICPGEATDVPTNVRIQLPPDIWAEIRARSSIARRGLQVDAGTIDPGYRGPLYVLVRNMAQPRPNELFHYWTSQLTHKQEVGFRPFRFYMGWQDEHSVTLAKGERIGQIVFRKITPVWIKEVDQIDIDTERGEGGFGSTGR